MLIRSFVKLTRVDPGFRSEELLEFSVSVPATKYPYDRDRTRFADGVMQKLSSLPGTRSVAVSFDRPLQRSGMLVTFEVDGRPPSRAESRPVTAVHLAGSTYFTTLGIRLEAGSRRRQTDWALRCHQERPDHVCRCGGDSSGSRMACQLSSCAARGARRPSDRDAGGMM